MVGCVVDLDVGLHEVLQEMSGIHMDMSSQSRLAAGEPAASSNDAAVDRSVDSPGRDPKRPDNPWNMFQHPYKGLGLNSKVSSRLYRDQKTHQP